MKFCRDCKFCELPHPMIVSSTWYTCRHPLNISEPDMVTGKRDVISSAKILRENISKCGPRRTGLCR